MSKVKITAEASIVSFNIKLTTASLLNILHTYFEDSFLKRTTLRAPASTAKIWGAQAMHHRSKTCCVEKADGFSVSKISQWKL